MTLAARAVGAPAVSSGPAADVVVRHVHRGRVTTGTVRSRLPACVSRTWFEPGPVMPHAVSVQAAVVTTATRCAPWLHVLLGPRLWSSCPADDRDDYACRAVWRRVGDTVHYEHRGLACWNAGVLLVAAADLLPGVMAVLHHEVWHAVERHGLASADVEAVDRAAALGVPQPGAYLSSAVERRARLYESWACAWDEGWRPASVLGWSLRRVDRVCWYVHGGGLARDVSRHGAGLPQHGPARAAALLGAAVGRLAVSWPVCLVWPLAVLLAVAAH